MGSQVRTGVEIDADGASAHEIKRSLENHGCVVLRGALAASKVDHYDKTLQRLYRRCEEVTNNSDAAAAFALTPDEIAAARHGDVLPDLFARFAGDNLRLEALFETPQINAVLRSIMRHPRPDLSTFMTVSPAGGKTMGGIALHTDGIIQGTDELVLTLWAPFQKCGTTAPGLTLVAAPTPEVMSYLREKFPGRNIPGWCSTTEWNSTGAFSLHAIEKRFGAESVWSPEFAPGDVALFTNWTIHGSRLDPTMTDRRSTAIMRVRNFPRWTPKGVAYRIKHHLRHHFGPVTA